MNDRQHLPFVSTHLRRVAVLLAAVAIPTLFTGCTYIRLAKFRTQMASFSDHVVIDRSSGLTLRFLHPLLAPHDLEFLMGAEPSASETTGQSIQLKYTFANSSSNAPNEHLTLTFTFRDGRLAALSLPEQIVQGLPPHLWEFLFKEIGSCDVDRARRRAAIAFEIGGAVLPQREAIHSLYGMPSAGTTLVDTYTFRLLTPRRDLSETHTATVVYTYSPEGMITDYELRYGRGHIHMWVPAAMSQQRSNSVAEISQE